MPNFTPGRNLFLTTLSARRDLLLFYLSDLEKICCAHFIRKYAWMFNVFSPISYFFDKYSLLELCDLSNIWYAPYTHHYAWIFFVVFSISHFFDKNTRFSDCDLVKYGHFQLGTIYYRHQYAWTLFGVFVFRQNTRYFNLTTQTNSSPSDTFSQVRFIAGL